ncbi:MAG: hypothetical protein UZ15_CFX003000574 [Chloroflexi bacterium OLB15]|nr:MAG: hypothetical protein UZ15_CFX003000574 [Chloroflexi bacterium OLB15]
MRWETLTIPLTKDKLDMRRILLLLLCATLLLTSTVVLAQEEAPTNTQTGVEIAWPFPISEVWQDVPVFGTASVQNLAFYFLEAAPLNDDQSIPENVIWIPISPIYSEPVVNDVLAIISTQDFADGLYAIRLNVVTTDLQRYYDTISPIRLNNERFAIESELLREQILTELGITAEETPAPTPETPTDTTPRVTPLAEHAAVNIRRCDIVDNTRCPITGSLPSGQTADVLALSANRTGWFQIRTNTGNVGWVSPTVVQNSGDFSNLPTVAPPTPLPPATAVPQSNVQVASLTVTSGVVCAVPIIANVVVTNRGNATSGAGTITLQDIHVRTGTVTATAFGNFPALAAGQSFTSVIPITVTTFYNEDHILRASVGNSSTEFLYTLNQGSCGPQATPAPDGNMVDVELPPNSCILLLDRGTPFFNFPNGSQVGTLEVNGSFNGTRITRVNGEMWYQFDNTQTEIRNWVHQRNIREAQGTCTIPGTGIMPFGA